MQMSLKDMMLKKARYKRIHPAQLDLYGVPEQAKLISVERNQSSVFLRARGKDGLEGGVRMLFFFRGGKCSVS